MVATCLSVVLQGIHSWVGNHTIYLPYALRYDELPQFENDAFHATLHNFISGYWWLLRQIATTETIDYWLWASHLLARLVLIYSLLSLALEMTGRVLTKSSLWATAMVVAVTPFLVGFSVIGDHNLFHETFSHTDLANATALLAVVLLIRQAWSVAFVVIGITFDLNAFVGIWVFTASLASAMSAGPSGIAASLRTILKPVACFAVVASPCLLWALSVSTTQHSVPFSYVQYLREYYPQHFLIEAVRPWDLVDFVIKASITLFVLVSAGQKVLLRFYLALLGILLFGTALPYVLDVPLLLNLHLLRVDGLMQFLSVAALMGALLRMLASRSRMDDLRAIEIIFIVALLLGQWILLAGSLLAVTLNGVRLARAAMLLVALVAVTAILQAGLSGVSSEDLRVLIKSAIGSVGIVLLGLFLGSAVLLPAEPRLRNDKLSVGAIILLSLVVGVASAAKVMDSRVVMVSALACLIAVHRAKPALLAKWSVLMLVVGFGTVPAVAQRLLVSNEPTQAQRSWSQLVQWVTTHRPSGVFLLPYPLVGHSLPPPDLALMAQVPVWVDWKQGAAVMWSPDYYRTWKRRMTDWEQLNSREEALEYACQMGIENVVVRHNETNLLEEEAILYSNDVYAIARPVCHNVEAGTKW